MGCGDSKLSTFNLFQETKVGSVNVKNRVVMAPMTRCRADPSTGVPNELHVQYYSDRAEDAGMVLTDCSSVSPKGNCFPGACGIWSNEQVNGWKKVTDEVHKKWKNIFTILSLWKNS